MRNPRTLKRFARNTFAVAAVVSAVMVAAELSAAVAGNPITEQRTFAATAGTAADGGVVLTPESGPLSTTLALSPDPAPAFCPGDSVAGYRWQTFIAGAANDPATFTYDSNGPVVPGGGAGVTFPLVSSTGINQVNRNTAADTGNGGQITPIPGFDLSVYGDLLVAGDYNIGFACTLAGETVRFWTAGITITASTFATSATTTTTTSSTTTTTTTTVVGDTTTTTIAGDTTTTSVAGGTTTTSIAGGAANATVTPASPTPGGSYQVAFPNCQVGETITFSQTSSTPATVTDVCEAPSALTSGSVTGFRMPAQTSTGTATGNFTAAPTAPGSYTVTMTGTASAQRTTTFVIVGPTTPVTGGNGSANTGGSPTGSSTGTIPSTGSSTTALIVWGVLMLVFGRMAILLGRKPKVLPGT